MRTAAHLTLFALISACAPSVAKDGTTTGDIDEDGLSGDGGDGTDGSDGGDGGEADCRELLLSADRLSWSDGLFDVSSELTVQLTNTCDDGEPLRLGVQFTGSSTFAVVSPTDFSAVELEAGDSIALVIAHIPDDYIVDEGMLTIADSRGLLTTRTVDLVANTSGDQDGDGAVAEEVGGDDCNDLDATIGPLVRDTRADLADDDCDGFVDEDLVLPGDLLITEVFAAPTAGDPALGEWFELINLSSTTIDMANWTIRDTSGQSFTLPAPFLIDAGDRYIIGASGDIAVNGGISANGTWDPASFSLDDTADSIVVEVEARPIASITYTASWTQREGRSMSLDREFTDPTYANDPAYWCTAYSTFGSGDYGSPGDRNNLCGNVDHDFDGYALNEGDCDDTDATLNPGETDWWDGLDNNCDGLVDGVLTASALGHVIGETADQLGFSDGLSTGDVDGDGAVDVLAGGSSSNSASTRGGVVYAMSAADVESAAGAVASTLDFATVEGTTTYGSMGAMPSHQQDLNGDGAVDLLVGGASYYGAYYGGVAAAVFFSGSVSGSLDDDEADVMFSNSLAYSSSVTTNELAIVDMDGDGINDVALGTPYTYSGGGTSTIYYAGMATVYLGSGIQDGDELDEDDADVYLTGTASSDYLGSALGGADLDGDGYGDLIVGAAGSDVESTNGGAVFVLLGSATPATTGSAEDLADLTIGGSGSSDNLGEYASPQVADWDGDGAADLALSSVNDGEVYVFWSAASLTGTLESSDRDVQLNGAGPDGFGYAMDTADIDGDGTPDLLVGAPDGESFSYSSGTSFTQPGEVSIFSGTLLTTASSVSSTDASFTLRAESNHGFGAAISTADTDGDGDDEVFVAAPGVPTYTSGTYTYPTGTIWAFDPQ